MRQSHLAKTPTWREMPQIIKDDANYPVATKLYDSGRIEKALAWEATRSWHGMRSSITSPSAFLDQPFTEQTVEQLFSGLRANELRVKPKTIDNTKSICRRIAARYHSAPPLLSTPLSEQARTALAQTGSKYERLKLERFMVFLSAAGISPWHATNAAAAAFRDALADVWQLSWSEQAFQRTMQCWNACARRYPTFPQITLTSHLKGPVQPSHAWGDTPGLEDQINAYLACGVQPRIACEEASTSAEADSLAAVLEHVDSLSPISVRNNKMALRMTVWVLHDAGVPFDQLKQLRDLCQPNRFRQALTQFVNMAGGVVNRTVFMRGVYLMRLSRHPGVLAKDEIKINAALFDKLRIKHKRYLKTHTDRDQALLDKLDDPSVMDALLALPTLTKGRVLSAKVPYTIQNAYAIQCALMLEIWLCAPYRLKAFATITRDQLVVMRIGNTQRVVLRGPANQSPGKHSPEHFLSDAAQDLLRLYLDNFLPLILEKHKATGSNALFPGRGGKPKSTQCLHKQIVGYVRKHTSLDEFHPHAIRKIVPKITLDADPGALEVARRTGGWSSTTMLHRVYGQTVHRVSQARYLELLQSKRLSAIRGVTGTRTAIPSRRTAKKGKPGGRT